jgi:hypothetical protein
MEESLRKLRTFSRSLILASVLAGICFSSGEGIRLLPFPAFVSRAIGVHSEQVGSGRANPYAPTVRNSSAPSVIAKLKLKDGQRLSGCPLGLSTKLQPVDLRAKHNPDNFSNADVNTASRLNFQQTVRGPPA